MTPADLRALCDEAFKRQDLNLHSALEQIDALLAALSPAPAPVVKESLTTKPQLDDDPKDESLNPAERVVLAMNLDRHAEEGEAFRIVDQLIRCYFTDESMGHPDAENLRDMLGELIEWWLPPSLSLVDKSSVEGPDQAPAPCPECDDQGIVSAGDIGGVDPCPTCGGNGYCSAPGFPAKAWPQITCPYCQPAPGGEPVTALELAKRFHTAYENLAPTFGYETRAETRVFDPESSNGKLMVAVCQHLAFELDTLTAQVAALTAERDALETEVTRLKAEAFAAQKAMPSTFYGDRDIVFRINHMWDGWNRAVKANRELEDEKRKSSELWLLQTAALGDLAAENERLRERAAGLEGIVDYFYMVQGLNSEQLAIYRSAQGEGDHA